MGKIKSRLMDNHEYFLPERVKAIGYKPNDLIDKQELFTDLLYAVRAGALNGHPVQIMEALCIELGYRQSKRDALINAAESAASMEA